MDLHVSLDPHPPDHEVRLGLRGFDGLDPCEAGAVVAALGAHLGLDAQALRKAAQPARGEPHDPRFPALKKLIALARQDWEGWGRQLVDAVVGRVRGGELLPMTPEGEAELRELFDAHEQAIVARFAGRLDAATRHRLQGAGLLPPEGLSFVELAWRLGRQVRAAEGPPDLPTREEERRPIEETIRALVRRPLDAQERAAIDYVQRRGAVYMRRPAMQVTDTLGRALTDEELRLLRGALGRAVEEREDWRATARRLQAAVQGHPTLINDFDRVARTELHFAHAEGALLTLKRDAADLGDDDPLVFKYVSPAACVDCRRIWGPMADPRRYRLSVVESRNGGRGNFGLPRSQWGPCVAGIHPFCSEGPLHRWHPKMQAAVEDLTKRLRDRFGS